MSHEAAPLPPYEDKGVTMSPEQLYRDSRVEGFAHTEAVTLETLGTAREAVVDLRHGLRTLTSGIEDSGLGGMYGVGVLEPVQKSGNEVVEQETGNHIAGVLAEMSRTPTDDVEKIKGSTARLERTARAAKAFDALSSAVVEALDHGPGSAVIDEHSQVGKTDVVTGPSGGGSQEYEQGANAVMDAVQMMSAVVSGRGRNGVGYIETQETRSLMDQPEIEARVAFDDHDNTVRVKEIPLARLGVSIMVREVTPKPKTGKERRTVETYIVSTVEPKDRRRKVGSFIEGGEKPPKVPTRNKTEEGIKAGRDAEAQRRLGGGAIVGSLR